MRLCCRTGLTKIIQISKMIFTFTCAILLLKNTDFKLIMNPLPPKNTFKRACGEFLSHKRSLISFWDLCFWSERKLLWEQMWCDCSRSPGCTNSCVLWDWGSLWGSWCCLESSSAGCVNTSQWIGGGGPEGSNSCRFIILPQFTDCIIMLSAHSYFPQKQKGCALSLPKEWRARRIVKWRISPVQSSPAVLLIQRGKERMGLNVKTEGTETLHRKKTLYERKRWPQPRREGREMTHNHTQQQPECVCSTAEGGLTGLYKDTI